MNRKQKVAVVVGVVVIMLLVLFPPWYDTYLLGPVRLRWVGSDPVRVEQHVDGTRVKRVRHEYAISYGLAAGAMLAALALTVAAVVVLKERKTR